MNILIVEPMFGKAKDYSSKVVTSGGSADHVAWGWQALEKLRKGTYAGVLISRWLPDTSGQLFYYLLKESDASKKTPPLLVESPEMDGPAITNFLNTLQQQEG